LDATILQDKSMTARVFLGLSLLMACGTAGYAGDRTNVRGEGMARTGVATARALDAMGVNPANLAMPGKESLWFNFFPLAVSAGTDFLDYGLYTTYFTGVDSAGKRVGRYLDDAAKREILDSFRDEGGTAAAEAEVRLFGAAFSIEHVGVIALTMTQRASATFTLPKDLAKFMLYGNIPGTVQDFRTADAKALVVREYALGFGCEVPPLRLVKTLRVGAAVKLLHGVAYFGVERFNASLATSPNGALTGTLDILARSSEPGEFSVFPQPSGTGYAVDLGVSGEITSYLSFGLSLTDVGAMQWTRNLQETVVESTLVIDDPFRAAQQDDIDRAFHGETRPSAPFYSTLPTQLHFGAAVQIDRLPGLTVFPGELLVALDYVQGFADVPGATTLARFSLGAEYAPARWFMLRTGATLGGAEHSAMALGLGFRLGFFRLDLASDNIAWLFAPTSFSSASVALGMQLVF
jgi:hypothetical protein